MKKVYEMPIIEITKIENPDIIMLSLGGTTSNNNKDLTEDEGIDFGSLFG